MNKASQLLAALLLIVWWLPLKAVALPDGSAGWLPDAVLSRLMLRTLTQAPDGLL